MKCYYEELSVERDASDADIKTAYRKQALRWHPDKNPDCLDEAKERFQAIQQAYEVLSDPQERAWYDRHREEILRGRNSDYQENTLDLFQYFTVSCYKGHGDDSKGFYAVYREVFGKIAAEDKEFMEDENDVLQIPQFGDSQSNYEEVVGPFYAYWTAYCTKKTYSWLCPYDITEIRDRRVLREVEKEMKKIVQKAKKERNDEVRALVAFVRKRDKRVQKYKQLIEQRLLLNREKQKQNRLDQIRKRQQEVEASQSSQHAITDYEEQLKLLAQQYSGSESSDEEEAGDEPNAEAGEEVNESEQHVLEELYCVACNRYLKNEKAFANHETSKKHRDNVERMREQMHEEEEAFREAENEASDIEQDDVEEDLASDMAENLADISLEEPNLNGHTNELFSDEEITPSPTKNNRKSKKNKKANKAQPASVVFSDPETEPHDILEEAKALRDSDEQDWQNTTANKKSAKKNKNKKQTKRPAELKPEKSKEDLKADSVPAVDVEPARLSPEPPLAETNLQHKCVTCNAIFPSKNKLFAHLKITNHGVYIPKGGKAEQPTAAGAGQKKPKGKRK